MTPEVAPSIRAAAERRASGTLGLLRALVERESPYSEKAAVDRLIDHLESQLHGRGGVVERVPQPEYGDFLVARFPGSGARPIHVMTHVDTVWPLGTLERLPWRVEDGRAYGPGVLDMKAGAAMMFSALDILAELRLPHPPIVWSLNTDEEPGSPVSRTLLRELARQASVVLCLEPPLADGALVVRRKGVGIFTLEITGRAAHAGSGYWNGVSATDELARQTLWLHGLTDRERGTTVNVGRVQGGTDRIVVAAEAVADVDLRVETLAEAERMLPLLLGASPRTPGTTVRMTGKLNKPPLEQTPANMAAFERAREIGRLLGLELTGGATGGGSDGNFTSAEGTPTLDGLGCPGAGAHADHEHVIVSELPVRTALLTALLVGIAPGANAGT
jgi:glutamate carboxypeptidase